MTERLPEPTPPQTMREPVEPDAELAFSTAPLHPKIPEPLQERDDRRVVAADRRDELPNSGRTCVCSEGAREGGSDAAALMCVCDFERHLAKVPSPGGRRLDGAGFAGSAVCHRALAARHKRGVKTRGRPWTDSGAFVEA